MENKKQFCENLLIEYFNLVEKTKMEVHDLGPGGKIQHPIPIISPEDLEKKIGAREKLHGCLIELSDESLEKLFEDDEFMGEAIKILSERKRQRIK